MSDFENFLEYLISLLDNNNENEFKKIINLFPIENFNGIEFFEFLLKYLSKMDSDRCFFEIVFLRWKKFFKCDDIEDVLLFIIDSNNLSEDCLKVVFKKFSYISIDIFFELMVKNIEKYRFRLLNLYKKLSKITGQFINYSNIEILIKKYHLNEELSFLLRNILKKDIKKFAPYPEWVNKIEDKIDTKFFNPNFWENETKNVCIEDVNELSNNFKLTNECKYVKDESKDVSLDEISQIALTTCSQDNNFLNLDPDRIFGPRNSILGIECKTGILGGCRMLTCNCFSENSEFESSFDNDNDWYSGICDTCGKKIRNISHSLRYPLNDGGWYGEYCCIEHMIENPPKDVDKLADLRIDNMVQIITEKGIYDRFLN